MSYGKIKMLSDSTRDALFLRLGVDTLIDLKPLGRGSYADAYWLPNKKKVFKITRDQTDAQASQSIVGKRTTYLVRTYDVFTIDKRFYGIINEKLTPLDSHQHQQWTDLRNIYETSLLNYGLTPLSRSGLTVAWAMEMKNIAFAKMYGNDAELFEEEFDNFILFASELAKYHILWKDWHSANIMNRGRTQVISDLGGNTKSPVVRISEL